MISHSSKKRGGQGEVTVSINGSDFRSTNKLDLPLATGPLFFDIGCSRLVKSEKSALEGSFFGQIASVFLFDDILSTPQIQALYDLGPNHHARLLPEDGELYPKLQDLFDTGLRGKLILNLNPKASKGDVCVDLSLRHQKPVHGNLQSVSKVVIHKFANTIQAQGGVKSLFPLALQVDSTQTGPTTNLSAVTLQLFRILIMGGPQNQEDFVEGYFSRSPLLFSFFSLASSRSDLPMPFPDPGKNWQS